MIAKTTTKGTGTFVVVLGRRLVIRKTTTKVPVPFVVACPVPTQKAGHLAKEMTRLSNQSRGNHGRRGPQARPGLGEHAGEVIIQPLILGPLENLFGLVVLDHIAHVEERRAIGHARRLLHVVRHDDDGAVGNDR